MTSTLVPGRPVLVISDDTALHKRIRKTLRELPLDAPGLPEPVDPALAQTAREGASMVGRAHRDGNLFGIAIVDRMDAASAAWSHDPTLPILLIGRPDANTLSVSRPDRLLLLPPDSHSLTIQQAVLVLVGRAAAEHAIRVELLELRSALAEQKATVASLRNGALEAISAEMSLADPELGARNQRIFNIVSRCAAELEMPDRETVEAAGRVALLGLLSLDADSRARINAGEELGSRQKRAQRLHPRAGAEILGKLPGMEDAASLLRLQTPDRSGSPPRLHPNKQLPAVLLKIAFEIDARICGGLVPLTAAEDIFENPPPSLRAAARNLRLVEAVKNACILERDVRIEEVRVDGLRPDMILYDDVHTTKGALVVSKNQVVSLILIHRLKRFADGAGIQEPMRVLVPLYIFLMGMVFSGKKAG